MGVSLALGDTIEQARAKARAMTELLGSGRQTRMISRGLPVSREIPHLHRIATATDLPQIVDIYNATIPSRLVTADLVQSASTVAVTGSKRICRNRGPSGGRWP
jgi:hypothetical protein